MSVAFWNFVGAGLFGVYGMLGIGLMLFCLRALQPGRGLNHSELRRRLP